MRAIYSVPTKIPGGGIGNTAFHGISVLHRRGFLEKALVLDFSGTDIPSGKLKKVVPLGSLVQKSLGGIRNRLFPDFPEYIIHNELYDYLSFRYIRNIDFDLLYTWGGHSLRTIRWSKEKGIRICMSGSSSHPATHRRLILEEYRLWNVQPSMNTINPYMHTKLSTELSRADFILPASEFVKESMINNNIEESRLILLPFGVDTKRFTPAKRKDDVFRVSFCGTVDFRKGVQYMLKAWESLNLKNAELVLFGSVRKDIRHIVKKYHAKNSIKFLDAPKGIEKIYNNSSIFVFPSIEEGSALVTYEAMACGLPVVTTHNAGSVARNGKDGFIVPIRDVKSLKDRILYFYENPAEVKRMGRNARKQAEKYTWGRYERNFAKSLAGLR